LAVLQRTVKKCVKDYSVATVLLFNPFVSRPWSLWFSESR